MSETLHGIAPSPVPDPVERRQRQCGDRGCTEPAYRCDGCGAEGCDYGLRKACRCEDGPDASALYEPVPKDAPGASLYLSADGYTVLARDDKGVFRPVGDVIERTPDGFVARLHGKIEGVGITGKVSAS